MPLTAEITEILFASRGRYDGSQIVLKTQVLLSMILSREENNKK